MFGPKSKVVCCAVYFAANSVADILLLTVRNERFWTDNTIFACVFLVFVFQASLQLLTWITAIFTVERSLTILWPFVIKSQTVRKRSGFVILVIVLLQLLAQYQTLFAHNFTQHTCYFLRYEKKRFERMIVALVLTLLDRYHSL